MQEQGLTLTCIFSYSRIFDACSVTVLLLLKERDFYFTHRIPFLHNHLFYGLTYFMDLSYTTAFIIDYSSLKDN